MKVPWGAFERRDELCNACELLWKPVPQQAHKCEFFELPYDLICHFVVIVHVDSATRS
jgi:hypothetical protein